MTLKERLEAVWQHKDIACATHFVKWNENEIGWSQFSSLKLWCQKGKIGYSKRRKYIGKSRWLFKGYGDVSRFSYRKSENIINQNIVGIN